MLHVLSKPGKALWMLFLSDPSETQTRSCKIARQELRIRAMHLAELDLKNVKRMRKHTLRRVRDQDVKKSRYQVSPIHCVFVARAYQFFNIPVFLYRVLLIHHLCDITFDSSDITLGIPLCFHMCWRRGNTWWWWTYSIWVAIWRPAHCMTPQTARCLWGRKQILMANQ